MHTFDATELEIASQEVQTLVQGIFFGHYPAVPSQENCRRCSYGEICELCHNELTEGNAFSTGAPASAPNGFPAKSSSAMSIDKLTSEQNLPLSSTSSLSARDLTTQTPDEFTSTSNHNASGGEESQVEQQSLSVQEPSRIKPKQEDDLIVESLSHQLESMLSQVAELYYRLIVIVEPPDGSQSVNLQKVASRICCQYINVNLELSRRLLELTQRQRSLKAESLLKDIVGQSSEPPVFLDHLEILFDASLKVDPLRCLQGLARHRMVVAVWKGYVESSYLIYAEPGHPEYRHYPTNSLLVISH